MCEQTQTPNFLNFHSKSHRDTILQKFDTMRKREILCDITLVVEDVHFRAHKALLAASSEYFSLMFTAEDQANQSVYRLDGMTAKTFASVLEFIYSASVSFEESGTKQLLDVARSLELRDLLKAHTDFHISSSATARGVFSDGSNGDVSTAGTHFKRRRGRPRKNRTTLIVPGLGVPSQDLSLKENGLPAQPTKEIMDSSMGFPENTEQPCNSNPFPRNSKDSEYDPNEERPRHGKRRIRRPVKLNSYRLEDEISEGRELKMGRKRKYPATEPRCDDCSKVFKNHLFLKIHQRTHTGEKPFRCEVCGSSFTQKHTLLVHKRIHTGEKPFVCIICSKALSTKHSLQEHMNLHAEKKSFSCDQCGKTYSQKRQLKSHYQVHTGKALPECAHCNHKFMDAAQLKKHLRTHTGEKPFTCEICGKCFTAKSTLQTHIRIHRGEKPYMCNICKKSFSDPSARRRHIASHTGKKPFTCSVCCLSFARLDNLKAHTKTHNKELPGTDKTQTPTEMTTAGSEKVRQIQQYQLPNNTEQEIQLVVTSDVDNVNLVASQKPGIGIITTDGHAEELSTSGQNHSGLTMLSQSSDHVQNLALVTENGDTSAQIQTISVVEGQMSSEHSEQMHVITLTKEAMDQLQVHHEASQLQVHHEASQQLQISPRPLQQLQVIQQAIPHLSTQQLARDQNSQSHTSTIHIRNHIGQPISISQTSEQIPSTQIQGQSFQIQAGTVSYLYTTSMAPHT